MMRSVLAFLFAVVATVAIAQENTPPSVKLVVPKSVKPGAKVDVLVQITFAEGLHGYQNPPVEDYQIPVKVAVDAKGFVVKKIAYPKGVMLAMGGDPKPTAVYDGTVIIPVTVTAPSKVGASVLKVIVSYQQCNDAACFPPATVSSTAPITIKK